MKIKHLFCLSLTLLLVAGCGNKGKNSSSSSAVPSTSIPGTSTAPTSAPKTTTTSVAPTTTSVAPTTTTIIPSSTSQAPQVIPLVSISLSESSVSLAVDDTKSLSVTYNPTNTTQTGVIWSSSAPSVTSVDQNGTVTALTYGSSTITATSSVNPAISASVTVTVYTNKVTVDEAKDALLFKNRHNVTTTLTTKESGNFPFMSFSMVSSNVVKLDGDNLETSGSSNSSLSLNKSDYFNYYSSKGITRSESQFKYYFDVRYEDYGDEEIEGNIYTRSLSETIAPSYNTINTSERYVETYYVDETQESEKDKYYFECDFFDPFELVYVPEVFDLEKIDFSSMSYDNTKKCYTFNEKSVYGFYHDASIPIYCEPVFKSIEVYFLNKNVTKVEVNLEDHELDLVTECKCLFEFSNYGTTKVTMPDKDLFDICDHVGCGSAIHNNEKIHYEYCKYCDSMIKGTCEEHHYDPLTNCCETCGYNPTIRKVILTRKVFGEESLLLYNDSGEGHALSNSHSYDITEDFNYILLPGEDTPQRAYNIFGGSRLFYATGVKTFVNTQYNNIVFPETYTFEMRNVGGEDVNTMIVTKTYHDPA